MVKFTVMAWPIPAVRVIMSWAEPQPSVKMVSLALVVLLATDKTKLFELKLPASKNTAEFKAPSMMSATAKVMV